MTEMIFNSRGLICKLFIVTAIYMILYIILYYLRHCIDKFVTIIIRLLLWHLMDYRE